MTTQRKPRARLFDLTSKDYDSSLLLGLEHGVLEAIRAKHPGHNMTDPVSVGHRKFPFRAASSVFVREFMLGRYKVCLTVWEGQGEAMTEDEIAADEKRSRKVAASCGVFY